MNEFWLIKKTVEALLFNVFAVFNSEGERKSKC